MFTTKTKLTMTTHLPTSPSASFIIRGHQCSAPKLPAGLYLVSTPIGNLGDITLRALETLAACDVIACEDTRTSGVLLKRYSIDRPKISYTEHNADTRGPDLLRQIQEGRAIALISDAGTPLVSDPGFRLVEKAVEVGITVIPIPGASAPLAALVGSGLGTDDFRFCGFLPSKAQSRLRRLKQLELEPSTLILFESPARICATLKAMIECFGADRPAVIARELTKMYENFHRGTLSELEHEFSNLDKVRGEIVIIVAPAVAPILDTETVTLMLSEALKTMKTKQASNHVADQTGLSKQELYKQALKLQ
ncbi:MAG: 16S rRNA (cytidine(1402)-2'-O)-methyltransferase [Rhizobiaceae bacterium]